MRHVADGAALLARGASLALLALLGDAEVDQAHVAQPVEEQVLALEVAVEDALRVHVAQDARDLDPPYYCKQLDLDAPWVVAAGGCTAYYVKVSAGYRLLGPVPLGLACELIEIIKLSRMGRLRRPSGRQLLSCALIMRMIF